MTERTGEGTRSGRRARTRRNGAGPDHPHEPAASAGRRPTGGEIGSAIRAASEPWFHSIVR